MPELLVAVRAIHVAATLLVLGTASFRTLALTPALPKAPPDDTAAFDAVLQRLALFGVLVAVLSGAAWFALFAAQLDADTTSSGELVLTILGETRFGHVALIRLVVAAMLAGLLTTPPTAVRSTASILLALVFALALGATGHLGAAPGVRGGLELMADLAHIAAASVWGGGLLPFALLLRRARHHADARWAEIALRCTRRFSLLAMTSVGVLVLTGTINGIVLIGTVEALRSTDYGSALLLKIALFLGMLFFAAVNRFVWTPRLSGPDAMKHLQWSSGAEIALSLGVVALVGLLGTLPPSGHAHEHAANVAADSSFVHLHSTEGMAEVTMTPGHPGSVSVDISLMAEDFTPLPARSVAFTLSNEAAGIPAESHDAALITPGSWRIERLTIPASGRWTIVLNVELDNNRRLTLDGPLLIEP